MINYEEDCRFGSSIYGSMMYLRNDKWIGKSYYHYNEALSSEVDLISRFVKPGDVALDAGANMGAIAIPLAKMVGEEGHVHAFEPQEFIYYTLCGNIALNNLYNVTAYHKALSARSGEFFFCVNKQLKNNDGVYFYDEEGQHYGGVYLTKARRCDNDVVVESLAIDALALPDVDFIKMDIEGAEIDALKGASDTIHECQPIMVIESMPWMAPKIIDHLRSIGYVHQSVRLRYFNEDNYREDMVDRLREDHDLNTPMMSSDMVCYPESRREELDMVFFKAMKELG